MTEQAAYPKTVANEIIASDTGFPELPTRVPSVRKRCGWGVAVSQRTPVSGTIHAVTNIPVRVLMSFRKQKRGLDVDLFQDFPCKFTAGIAPF